MSPPTVVILGNSRWVILAEIYAGCRYNDVPAFWGIQLHFIIWPVEMHTKLSALTLNRGV